MFVPGIKFHFFPSVHIINKWSYVLTHIFPVLHFFPSYPSAADTLHVSGMYLSLSNFWWCACSRWHLCSTLSLSPSPALPAPRFSCQFLLPSSTQWYWHLSRLHLFVLIFLLNTSAYYWHPPSSHSTSCIQLGTFEHIILSPYYLITLMAL